jgi:hypothetical protein
MGQLREAVVYRNVVHISTPYIIQLRRTTRSTSGSGRDLIYNTLSVYRGGANG